MPRRVARARRLSRPGVVDEPVADEADGLERAASERLVDALSELPDVHLDDVRVAVVREVPDVAQDRRLRQHLTLVSHQELQERELPRRQLHRYVAAPGLVRRRVQTQVTDLEHDGPLPAGAAHQRAEPSGEHHEREGLGQEVVGPGVERTGLLLGTAPGGEHQDRCPVARLPQPRAQLVARQAGQHHVDDHRVVRVLGREPLTLGPVEGDVDRVALGLEPATQARRELLVILHDQDPHPASVAPTC
ncbi:hypothetical protein ASE24_21175 [Nocardioides sp. Root224]|nr:hypothetical protein ASE24_21175 [Nocardioides sp. Root224]